MRLQLFPLLLCTVCLLAIRALPQHRPRDSPSSTRTPTHPTVPAFPAFVDVAHASDIDFHLTCGGREKHYIIESMCDGAAVFDYDNDSWIDILFIDDSTLEDLRTSK